MLIYKWFHCISPDINLIFSILSPYICPEYPLQLPLAKIWPMAGFGLAMMMLMRKKHYGFRSGNDIKAGGFCTGTNDQEKQEAWDPILPLDEEGNDDFDNSKWKGISSHYIPYHHFCPLFYVLSFYACILSPCDAMIGALNQLILLMYVCLLYFYLHKSRLVSLLSLLLI